MFHSEYTKSGSVSFCSSQSNDSRGPQDDLYAALPLLHDCQEQPILSIQTEQKGILNLYKAQREKVAYLDVWAARPRRWRF